MKFIKVRENEYVNAACILRVKFSKKNITKEIPQPHGFASQPVGSEWVAEITMADATTERVAGTAAEQLLALTQ